MHGQECPACMQFEKPWAARYKKNGQGKFLGRIFSNFDSAYLKID